jgi:hypothetical protein
MARCGALYFLRWAIADKGFLQSQYRSDPAAEAGA